MSDAVRTIRVLYFALLREQRGCGEEELETAARTPLELFEELREQYGLALDPGSMKVVVNEAFCEWSRELQEGDEVAFVPPIAGG